MTHDELVSIASQLVARVHDDDPQANGRWLAAVTDAEDRWALLFVLAAMVPDEVATVDLLEWTMPLPLRTGLSTEGPSYGDVVAERFQVPRRAA